RNGMVAVAAGTYVENIQLNSDHKGVHLAGRCRDLVVIDGSEGEEGWETGSGIYLEVTGMAGSWEVSGVTVTRAPWSGIFQYYGTLGLGDVSVIDNGDRGIQSYYGSTEITGALVRENHSVGIFIAGGNATLEDVQVLETGPSGDGTVPGYGIQVKDSTLVASDCLVQENQEVGMLVMESTLTLDDIQFLDNRAAGGGTGAQALLVQDFSDVVATGCVLQGNEDFGVYLIDSEVTLEELQVLDTVTTKDQAGGIVVFDSNLELTDGLLQGNSDHGMYMDASTATVQDLRILDTRASPSSERGRGLCVQYGSFVEATDSLIQGNHDSGIFVYEATATLQNVQVLDTLPGQGVGGRGIQVQYGSMLATDCLVQGNRDFGILVIESIVTLDSVEILETALSPESPTSFGITSQLNSTVTATDLLVQANEGPDQRLQRQPPPAQGEGEHRAASRACGVSMPHHGVA
ncbi:MAG: right-handed parallel beta-helix repeat-containing protein, partial [Myxococcota bacterium]|nr:right-handed parallel beta-helix repeat-containing protein [Myxococcota bacterium]